MVTLIGTVHLLPNRRKASTEVFDLQVLPDFVAVWYVFSFMNYTYGSVNVEKGLC